MRDALERLRPLASEVLLAVFGLAMTEATEKAFGRELERESEGADVGERPPHAAADRPGAGRR